MAGEHFNEDFSLDELINSALDEVENRYRSDNLSENEDLKAAILEKLPEDACYRVTNLVGSSEKFKFRATSPDITTESLNRWLMEFQIINDVSL